MAEILLSKLNTLPATADANELLFIKNGSLVSMYITDVEGTPVGVIPAGDYVKQVNGSGGNVQLNLSFSGGNLGITGGNNVNLDNRYFKSTDHISWGAVDNKPTTLGGYGITDAYTKTESDAITGLLSNLSTSTKTNLVSAINELLTSINEGMRTPEPIDCSGNPNYPASQVGDTYKVTKAGKIGGASGKVVEVNDTIVCTATNGGGDQATVGGSFYIIQGNITDATTTVKGLGRIATQAEVTAGNEDQAWVTPSTLSGYMSNYYTKAQVNSQLSGKQDKLSGNGFVKINGSTISYDNNTYVTTSRSLSAGSGLTGGGNLSADRSFAIDPSYSSFTNYYTKTQADNRYLQGFTETDPVYTADKPNIMLKGSIPSDTNIETFYDIGVYYHGSGSTGTTNDPFAGSYGLVNFDMNYMLRFANNTKYNAPKIQWGARGDLTSWKNMVVEGSNISLLNNDANYLTAATVPTPSLQAVTVAGNTTTKGINLDLNGSSYGILRGFVSDPIGGYDRRSAFEVETDGAVTSGTSFGMLGDGNGITYSYWTISPEGSANRLNKGLWLFPDGSIYYTDPPASTSAASQILALDSNGHTVSTRTASEILSDIGAIGNKFVAGVSWDDAFSTGTAMLLTASGGAPSSKTYNGIYIPHSVDVNYGTELAFRDNEMYFRSKEAGTINAWVQIADRGWVTSQNYLTSLPIATSSILGGIKVGSRLSITAQGTLSADKQTDNNFTTTLLNKLNGIQAGANNYTLPIADVSTLGGVKIGNTMVMNNQSINAKVATSSNAGIVKPGGNMAVDAQGTITAQWKEVEW